MGAWTNKPQSLLLELHDDRERLIASGVPEDGRGVHFISETDKRFFKQFGVWLIGNSIVTRTLITGGGQNGDGWHSQLIDINLRNGDLYRFGESNYGAGGGWVNIFSQDFHPGTTGVEIRQAHNLLLELSRQMIAGADTVEIEPYRGDEPPSAVAMPQEQ